MSESVLEKNKAILRLFIEEAWTIGNVDVIDDIFSENYDAHPMGVIGGSGMKQHVVGFRAAFPDLRITIDDLIAEGEIVVARATMYGTQKGEFFGIPPTGKEVNVSMFGIDRIVDGKIVEGWGEVDMLTMMQQLGVAPSPGQGG